MIGCSAPFCNNSTAKGYIVKIFPKNPERRAQWVANMNVKNWVPSDRSYLCEVHFSPEMWEQRRDNKPKLKPNAVPTIFGFWLTEKTFRRPEDKSPLTNSVKTETICDEGQSTTDQCSVKSTICDEGRSTADQCLVKSAICDGGRSTTDKKQLLLFTKNTHNYVSESLDFLLKQNNINQEHQTLAKVKGENEKLRKALDATTTRLLRMRKESQGMRDALRRIKHVINENKYKKVLNMIFNEDQIRALCNKGRTVQNWSNDTIKRALKLKFACGNSGYEELLKQNLPLPSLRTLRRKLDGFKFENGFSTELLEFLECKESNFENNTDKE